MPTDIKGIVDEALEAEMDRDEAAGAGNLQRAWTEHERLRSAADDAVRRYQAGQASAADTASVVERYNAYRETNRYWLEPRQVQRPWWQFWGPSPAPITPAPMMPPPLAPRTAGGGDGRR